MSREFFLYHRPRYFWTQLPTLPSGHRKFEGQHHPHFWGGEIELWRHESAFPWSYGTNSPRVRFPAFQPRKAFFRPLASFTGLFWYKCHLPNIQKRPNTALALIPSWQTIGDVKWRPSPKGAEEQRRSKWGPGQHLCWREAYRHQAPLMSLMCGPPQVTNRKDLPHPWWSDCPLRHWMTQLANNRLQSGLLNSAPCLKNSIWFKQTL